jgi:hypothetical protein
LTDFLQTCHAITREFNGPVPIEVDIAGSEYGYLAKNYLHADEMSEQAPRFQVVSGFATSKEVIAQQLLNLVGMTGADGEPLLRTREFKKQYPDPSVWPQTRDIQEVMERRVLTRNQAIRDAVDEFRQSSQFPEDAPPEWVEMAAQQVHMQLATSNADYEPKRDDVPPMHIEGLSELTQDPAEDPIARRVAELVQDLYYEWMSMMQQPQDGAVPTAEDGGGAQPTPVDGAEIIPSAGNPALPGAA